MDSQLSFEEIDRLFANFLNTAVDLLPRLILAATVLLIGLLLAWLVKRIIRRLILYLDKNINERLRKRFLAVDVKSSALFIGRLFYWFIIVVTITVISQVLGFSILTALFSGLINYLPNIIAALIIVIAGVIIGKLVGDLIASAAARTGIPNGKQLGIFVQYNILVVSIILAIDQIGIDIQFLTLVLIIVLGALLFGAALAFGLGAQTAVSNILGSYYVLKNYQEGNTIKMGEVEGIIVKITPTAVIVDTDSGRVMIPARDFNLEKTTLIKKN